VNAFRRCFRFAAFASIAPLAAALAFALVAVAGQKIHITPKFFSGETLRYRIQTRTATKGTTTTPISNPEGGTELNLATRLVVRLDVLAAPAAASAAEEPGPVRLRATYETSEATAESDAVNPGAASPEDQYKRLEGHSIEFTIGPGGVTSDFQGLDEIFPNRSDAEPMLTWARGISAGAGFPNRGIEIGQKWTSERELDGMPLTGLLWRTESTYLRNEPCNPAGVGGNGTSGSSGANVTNPAAPPVAAGPHDEECAVILTQFEILRHASAHADATPDDFRRSGLRTSGKWSGSGESLDTISLGTGLLVSSTQTSAQDVDYQIVSTNTGSSIHRTGHVTTKTEITLLSPSAAPKS
jgi:hypothetical protein